MVGGIVGSAVGPEGIPHAWLEKLLEPTRSVQWMKHLAHQLDSCLETGITDRPIKLPIVSLLFRNLFFLIIVIVHGFRRLLPPY
jgi:hypothetical protein